MNPLLIDNKFRHWTRFCSSLIQLISSQRSYIFNIILSFILLGLRKSLPNGFPTKIMYKSLVFWTKRPVPPLFNPLQLKLIYITFKHSVRTAKKTQLFTITKINWLTLFKEIIAVYSENYTKHINTLCGKMQNRWLLNQVVLTITTWL
jgi:hypothetical protein